MSFNIVKASHGEAVDMAYIKLNAWRESYYELLPSEYLDKQTEFEQNYFNFQKKAMDRQKSLFAIYVNNVVVGLYEIKPNSEEDLEDVCVQIDNVCILPAYWNRGFGQKAIRHARKYLRASRVPKAYVWIFPQNSRARYFFEKCGFVADGKEREIPLPDGGSIKQVRMVMKLLTDEELKGNCLERDYKNTRTV